MNKMFPLCIAHRGASGVAPENTMIAFWTAAQSADIIELDIQLSKDLELVVFHDRDLSRITGENRGIADFTVDELNKKDVGSWKDKKFLEERIPVFEQVLNKLPSTTSYIFEIKPQNREIEMGRILERKLINLLDIHSPVNVSYISVRDIHTYKWIKENSNYPVGLMQKKRTVHEYHELLKEYNISIAQIRINDYSYKDYIELNKIVDTVNVFYADNPKQWRKLFDFDVSGIFTNYPSLLKGYFDQLSH